MAKYSTRIIRDRTSLLATIAAIRRHPSALAGNEQKFLNAITREAAGAQPIILSAESLAWLRSIARKRRVAWPEGEHLHERKSA